MKHLQLLYCPPPPPPRDHHTMTHTIRYFYRKKVGWLVGCLGLTAFETVFQSKSGRLPKRGNRREKIDDLVVLGLTAFQTVFQSISGRLPKRGRKRREKIEESKNVLTAPTRTYCKRNRPLPYYYPNCRLVVLVGCFGFNGPLRHYFSLYRAVSQREGERG